MLLPSALGPGRPLAASGAAPAPAPAPAPAAASALRFIDGRDVFYVAATTASSSGLSQVRINDFSGVGSAASADGMEKEVQMALRGEKDLTVIA